MSIACVSLLSTSVAAQQEQAIVPPFRVATLDGGTMTDEDLGSYALFLFTIAGSEAGDEAVALVRRAAAANPEIAVYLVTSGDSEALRAMVADEAIQWPVLLDEEFLLASVFNAARIPLVCLIRGGVVAERLERDFTAEELAAAIVRFLDPQAQNAPLDVSLAVGFLQLSEPLLVAFVGADCPVCHAMLPQLHAIAEWFPVMLVVTEQLTGPEVFRSPAEHLSIALDPEWRMAGVFDVYTVPTLFLWNVDGSLAWRHAGYVEGLSTVVEVYSSRPE